MIKGDCEYGKHKHRAELWRHHRGSHSKAGKLVAEKLREPNSLLTMLEFKRFMDNLPYGKVSFDTLTALCEQVMENDSKMALLLLNYATEQELYLQKHSKSIFSFRLCRASSCPNSTMYS